MRVFFIAVLIVLAISIAAIFIYRYQIFQYSAETIIRKSLPEYIRIDRIEFDLKNNRIAFGGFKILNPEGFANRYFLEISEIACSYKMKGRNLIDGFEIVEPSFKKPVLNIERLKDGKTNIDEMKGYIESPVPPKKIPAHEPEAAVFSRVKNLTQKIIGDKTLPDLIKLPQTFIVKEGEVLFIDRVPYSKPHLLTFENIDAELSLRLDDSYSKILNLSSTGRGDLNGNKNEVIKWTIFLNPTTPKLTMSNRFEVSNADILTFEPYYDRFSPFIFKRGAVSGTLVFDFDNGNIGSTNEVRISDFLFYIKRGYENEAFWETNVQDLAKYFTSSQGDIVFDFKIKGEMSKPEFHLGPISKKALVSMAVGKISDVIGQLREPQKEGASAPGKKSDIEKAAEYIELFKGLIKKK